MGLDISAEFKIVGPSTENFNKFVNVSLYFVCRYFVMFVCNVSFSKVGARTHASYPKSML